MKIVKNKSFYKSILTITLPVALQNLISLATSMMDSLMLGRADDTGLFLSASSLANQPFFVLSLIAFGLGSASMVLNAQYWGKRDTESIRRVIAVMIKVAMVLSGFMGFVVLIFPEFVMRLYSNNADVISAGAKYLRIIGTSYFTFGFSSTMLCAIRAVELVKISAVVNLSTFFLNTFLNWVLIFGNFGAPAMGIEGAALATLIARIMELIITVVYVFKIDKRLCFKIRDLLSFDKILAKDFFKYGTPVFLNELIWSLGITVQAAILGHITYSQGDPVAANSIAGMVQQLSNVVILGIANAAAVILGKSIGEGEIERAKIESNSFKMLSVLTGIISGVLIILIRKHVVSFYTVPEETKLLAEQLMVVIALITVILSFSTMSIVGILRAGGDTKFCLLIELCTMWGAAIPLALLGSKLGLAVPIVLFLMKTDEIIKTVLEIIRMRNDKWIRVLTR